MSGAAQMIIAAGLLGGVAIWLRAAMLKPQATAWVTAPSIVSLSLSLLGILLLVMAIHLGKVRGRFTYDEAMGWLAIITSTIALTGLVLLVNLWIQHSRPAPLPPAPATPKDTPQ
jgi:hypothetical protein